MANEIFPIMYINAGLLLFIKYQISNKQLYIINIKN